MESTVFLAQLWGPVLLAVGVGLFVNRGHYIKVYRDLESEPLATLGFGVLALAVGLAQLATHDSWDTLAASIVSLLGWGAFLKGLALLVNPRFATHAAHAWARAKFIPLAGAFTFVVGAYLTWFAYLA